MFFSEHCVQCTDCAHADCRMFELCQSCVGVLLILLIYMQIKGRPAIIIYVD